ncbi:MAG: nickel-responsive transcriptional regulator NikR [Pseudomonadota bacterium]
MPRLERISITIEPELLAQLDAFVAATGHSNRSEAIRDLIRGRLVEETPPDTPVTGVVAITYDHAQRELSDRLVHVAHDHHGMVLATTHVHLDAHHCLEMSALVGPRSELEHYAQHIIGLKGVDHGAFMVTRPVP